jgi:hypothetical protein
LLNSRPKKKSPKKKSIDLDFLREQNFRTSAYNSPGGKSFALPNDMISPLSARRTDQAIEIYKGNAVVAGAREFLRQSQKREIPKPILSLP